MNKIRIENLPSTDPKYNPDYILDGSSYRKKTKVDVLIEKREKLKNKIADYVKNARLKVVDDADYVKVGQYNAQVALAHLIIAGLASDEQISTALSSKYAQEKGFSKGNEDQTKDEVALAKVWLEMSRQMLGGGNAIDTMAQQAMAAVDSSTEEQLDALADQLEANADQALPQFLGILNS